MDHVYRYQSDLSNSPSAVVKSLEPVTTDTYDDTDVKFVYTGTWTADPATGAYDDTHHHTAEEWAAASLTFTGSYVTLKYTRLTNRGEMLISIDGEEPVSIDAYDASLTWQYGWGSERLSPGTHTIYIQHPGGGHTIDVDAVIVSDLETMKANDVPNGIFDNISSKIHYSGHWFAHTDAGAYASSGSYSDVVGQTANFTFNGTQVSLLYTGFTNRGEMEVYIDGELVHTIDQYSAIATWQNRWNSPVLPSGPHTVTLKHADGAIVELDAVIVSGPATTATPTITPTVTPTITGTLTGTPVPTETPPPPLQSAEYVYDGDGNMVKGVVNGVETYYPGRHYNEEVDGSTSTVKKFYTMGSTTVAVRTVSGTEDVLNWILGDHLGSASVTANADGSWNSELKYTAFGEVRTSSGLTPTEYRYTNQRYENSLGLYYYVARWYDPYLNQFVQPDSIIPEPANAANWNRYAYTNYNPINFTDPSGHFIADIIGWGNGDDPDPDPPNVINYKTTPRWGGGKGIVVDGICSKESCSYSDYFLYDQSYPWSGDDTVDAEQFDELLFDVFLRVWYMDNDGRQIAALNKPGNFDLLLGFPDWYWNGDTIFYDNGNEEYQVTFEEGPHAGTWNQSDVNYLMIGMLGKASGMDIDETLRLSASWKKGRYGYGYSEDTQRWVEFGYMYYSVYEEEVGPGLPRIRRINRQSFGEWYESVE